MTIGVYKSNKNAGFNSFHRNNTKKELSLKKTYLHTKKSLEFSLMNFFS